MGLHALWIQTLSEKVQKSLQMIVNYTPVTLPFRRYDWIHRDGTKHLPTGILSRRPRHRSEERCQVVRQLAAPGLDRAAVAAVNPLLDLCENHGKPKGKLTGAKHGEWMGCWGLLV